jgi:hypothetical protein
MRGVIGAAMTHRGGSTIDFMLVCDSTCSDPRGMQLAQAPQPQIQFQYVDRPEVVETFADHVQRIQFDGQTLRLEFCVTRLEDQKSGEVANGKRYPACRLVLSASAAVDLMNKMQQITAGLLKAGVLKADAPASGNPS